MTTKVCSKCHVEKSVDDFSPSVRGKYGRRGDCKECHNAVAATYFALVRSGTYVKTQKETIIELKCRICEEVKCISEFKKRKGSKYGIRNECYSCSKLIHKKWRVRNKEKTKKYAKNYVVKHKEYHSKICAEWTKKNRYRANLAWANRHARKLNATPKWLTDEHISQMRAIYKEAADKRTFERIVYHVDHIHPLQGKNFCGLHVPWNLQIMTREENCSKSNNLPREEVSFLWENIE